MPGRWIGTSWKMNKTRSEAFEYAQRLLNFLKTSTVTANLFIIPPFTVLHAMARWLKESTVRLGAQNMHWEIKGAYTGEIAPVMVKDCGAEIVELGHSERRQKFAETDETVNLKVVAALANSLRPLICVGETYQQKKYGVAKEAVISQLKIALNNVAPEAMVQVLIAYEPVWAIGDSGRPADPEYANQMHSAIRKSLIQSYGENIAEQIPILYGGSVNMTNAENLIRQPEINGLFVGRTGWKAEGMIELIKQVEALEC